MHGLKDSPRIQKRNGTYLNINTMRLISTIEFLYEGYILKTRQTLTSLPYSWWFCLPDMFCFVVVTEGDKDVGEKAVGQLN